jgi:hypothetical protein
MMRGTANISHMAHADIRMQFVPTVPARFSFEILKCTNVFKSFKSFKVHVAVEDDSQAIIRTRCH